MSTWYAKLENKIRNHPEECTLVIETILDESIEPVSAQGCQGPSYLGLHYKHKLVQDIKCTSMRIGVSLMSVTNSAVKSWGAGGSWAAARRQQGRRSSRDAILLSAEMLLPEKNIEIFLGRGRGSKALVICNDLLQFWHFVCCNTWCSSKYKRHWWTRQLISR